MWAGHCVTPQRSSVLSFPTFFSNNRNPFFPPKPLILFLGNQSQGRDVQPIFLHLCSTKRAKPTKFQTTCMDMELSSSLGHDSLLKSWKLDRNNISGTIPSDFGNLKILVSFDLYLNDFSGSILDSLGKLTKLRFLYPILLMVKMSQHYKVPWCCWVVTLLPLAPSTE
ncbi:putative leucine-rich repeat receptor-like serine/threonine-protein kinase At2g24130 isoform X3 [Macadamia integrifolia]|uniref:putative leucine-rich repeat receptor-like serine/threonine-protein kinase At2g24130 isoform X3 n=1 Tax=Macadamia integrifolia TaxID=60698 RepID=UPI001C4E30C0|nr:putative leucine-rich repeat receptor-like serine/threonine-protein kinase At2g24130 isoform X3 [Macadamia integrifolia]